MHVEEGHLLSLNVPFILHSSMTRTGTVSQYRHTIVRCLFLLHIPLWMPCPSATAAIREAVVMPCITGYPCRRMLHASQITTRGCTVQWCHRDDAHNLSPVARLESTAALTANLK